MTGRLLFLALGLSGLALGQDRLAEVAQGFLAPPDDSRVMMRWWWFGPAVERGELQREIRAMKAGGIGGFEIQPVYPLSLDDPARGTRNLPYLSDDFIDALRFAAEQGRAQSMRVDLTLGSGWPFGGPHVPITQAASQIAMAQVSVPTGAHSVPAPAPAVGAGEKLLAAFIARGTPDALDITTLRALPLGGAAGGRIAIDVALLPVAANDKATAQRPATYLARRDGVRALGGEAASVAAAAANDRTNAGATYKQARVEASATEAHTILFFMQTRTGQQVKRPGVGGEGFVLDHLSRAAIDNHLRAVGDRLLSAFGDRPPDAVFSDSLEVYRADWTDDFTQEFAKRRGYDLLPHLPALFFDNVPNAQDIRHDWGRTLSELVDERYLTPVDSWAKSKGTRLRSQTYGFPPATLSSNALVALPEGEGHAWRQFSTTRWASSANHLYGRPVTSAESWTWLHSPAFRATPLDLKAEADTLFLQGVNQLIGHGWPYTPSQVAEPGWALYAAAVFNDHNPWWLAMPDITRYLQRVSYLLRQGDPVADVAIYLPTNDAWAATTPGRATVSDEMRGYITDELTTQLLNSGYSFDYVDATSIEKVGLKHRALILPHVTRIPPDTYRRIAEYAKANGVVIAIGKPPSLGSGFLNADAQKRQVEALSHELFGGATGAAAASADVRRQPRLLASDLDSGATLQAAFPPDLQLATITPALGFVHRRLPDGELYFVANTSAEPIHAEVRFRDRAGRAGQQWNPVTGAQTAVDASTDAVALELAPYESRVWVFGGAHEMSAPVDGRGGPGVRSDPALDIAPSVQNVPTRTLITDLSKNWTVRFEALNISQRMPVLRSWTDDEATRTYSGIATYSRDLTVPRSAIRDSQRLILSFGEGTPVLLDPQQRGSRAWLESPIREAAEIFVNGQRAGSVWCPPYELDLTHHLRAGRNRIELRVGNLAINTLAGRAPADYRLLNARYGERFTPQDMENLQPLPSGVLGPVTLLRTARHAPVQPSAPTKP